MLGLLSPLRRRAVGHVRSCLAACALLAASGFAAAEWVVTKGANTAAIASYDNQRVRRSGQLLYVWTRAEGAGYKDSVLEYYRRNALSPSQTQQFIERFAYRLTHWQVDCALRTMKTLAVADFDAAGEPVYTNENPGEASVIFPDSVVDAAAQSLCLPARTRKRS